MTEMEQTSGIKNKILRNLSIMIIFKQEVTGL